MTETLTAIYFPAAMALGALHALEPGHAKALTAAYLIGIKGTKRDSVILGLSVATTHSIVVIGISLIALWLGNEAFSGQAVHWLERGSGLVAMAIGAWMFWRRWRGQAHRHHSHENHEHHEHHEHHGHEHLDDVAHAKAHTETLPEYVKKGERPRAAQIVAFGAAGGMIPCPASITVMLLALSTGRAAMGVFTVFGFSLGLALTLVGVGLLVVTGLSRLSNDGRFSRLISHAPLISAGLVMLSGLSALLIAH